ncbi:polysaccharide deacetylase family protein [Actinomadura roseirufa]|uniref:polysaccharide deacetylase family protein n=1 Tax=Actinomadura roseirufa TaxID=2094049 RepID=UPI001F5FF148|nr:polysaccharide deacetylase family protein [Actinomadura roseirufa]
MASAGLLLAGGCGHAAKKDARTAGGTAGRQMAARQRPAPPPVTQKPPPPKPVDCDHVKCVALTFDDGPGPYTGRLLDTLKAHDAHATFFMLGENVHPFSGLVRRMVVEGHEVANHSWSHPQLTALSPAAVRSQVKRTQDAIATASGGVRPTLMRPPYGATNKQVGHAVAMPLIMWSVDTLDWRYRNAARNARVGVNEPKRGGIVLFHDIHKPSVDSIPKVLEGLKRRGFTFVTVSELFRGKPLKPGQSYSESVPPAPPAAPSSPAPGSPTPTPSTPETGAPTTAPPGTSAPESPTPSPGASTPSTPAPGSPAPESTTTGPPGGSVPR